MASDVLITPSSGLIQFSSSAGSGSGAIQADGDNLVISNELGDVLLGDGASDVFIGDGTNNVDIIFEQNGEIQDDGSGKSITLGSKTTNIFITGSSTIALQKDGGNVGIGTTSANTLLDVKGDISASGDIQISSSVINTAGISGSGTISGFTSASIASGSFDGISIGNASPPPGQELVVEGNISASGTINAVSMSGDGSGLTGVTSTATVDIDGFDAFSGVPHATDDEFLISDDGTEKRATMTMVANGGFALVSGDATIAAGGALTIAATAVENGMLADNAVDTEEIADNAVTTAKITDANVTLAKIANAAANTVIVRDANSSGVLSAKAVTNTQILIGDGTGFTAAALSGDVTMTNGGAVTIANNAVEEAMIANNAVGNDQMADNAIGNAELKQNDDITLQSLTLTGDLTVNGTTTTIATTNTKVEDKFMFLATGSAGTNTDAGIMVQSGSVDLSGSAFYHDVNVVAGTNPNGGRWSVAKSVGQDVGAVNPLQFVTTVKTETVNPNSTSGSYGAGEMHVNTTTGDIWIRFG